jgi:hypothetical protein
LDEVSALAPEYPGWALPFQGADVWAHVIAGNVYGMRPSRNDPANATQLPAIREGACEGLDRNRQQIEIGIIARRLSVRRRLAGPPCDHALNEVAVGGRIGGVDPLQIVGVLEQLRAKFEKDLRGANHALQGTRAAARSAARSKASRCSLCATADWTRAISSGGAMREDEI